MNVDAKGIAKGDEVVVKKQLKAFKTVIADVDDMFTVKDVFYNSICITNDNTTITVDDDTFSEHFEKYVEPEAEEPEVESEYEYDIVDEMIAEIMEQSEIIVDTVFDRCTIMSCKLPNGFVLVESSSCANPEDYDADLGIEICLGKITDKIIELEAYRIQQEVYESSLTADDTDCKNCEYRSECFGEN